MWIRPPRLRGARCRRPDIADHRLEAVGLGLQEGDLALDPGQCFLEIQAPLGGVGRVREAFAVAFAGRLVLEELADLGQREPGVVAEALDEAQPFEVAGVEEAVVPVRPRCRLQQPDLLVVADRARRQADLGGDLLDAQEARLGGRGVGGRLGRGVGHHGHSTLTLTLT